MSPVDWYFARGNKQSGPVSSVDLKRLADVGDLRPDDLVWREGLTEWVMARNVRGLFNEDATAAVLEPALAKTVEAVKPEAVQPPAEVVAPRVASRHLFDVLLDRLRSGISDSAIDTMAAVFHRIGLYGLWVAMAANLAFAVVVAMRPDVQGSVIIAVSDLSLLMGLQYAAGKANGLADRLNAGISARLSSAVLPDCVAVLAALSAAATLLGSIATAAIFGYFAILLGVAAFVVLGFMGLVAARPACVNVVIAERDEVETGEEALAVLTFLVKCLVRAVPAAFGVGVICVVSALAVACYAAFAGEALLYGLLIAAIARWALFFFAVLPLAAYLLLLLYGLLLELCRAILARRGEPAKLASDAAAKK